MAEPAGTREFLPISEDRFLDIDAAYNELQSLGSTAVTLRQVKRWAGDRRLPFFKFQRSLYIRRSVLRAAFDKLQQRAMQLSGDDAGGGRQVPARK
jgi:hypothetical protein